MAQFICQIVVGTEIPNLHETCECASNDLILGSVRAILLKLANCLTLLKGLLFQAFCEINAPAYAAYRLVFVNVTASQPNTQTLLNKPYKDGSQQSIKCWSLFGNIQCPMVLQRDFIPCVEAHVPQVADRDAVLCVLDRSRLG